MLRKCLLLFFIIPFSLTHAQEYQAPCGTVGKLQEEIIPQLMANKALVQSGLVQFRETVWVPIKFHLVARNDGSGRVMERDLLNQLCILNEDFFAMDIQFYIEDGFNYIENTTVFDNHVNTQNTIMTINRSVSALNVFIVNDATPNSDGIGTTLGYYTRNRDWVVMRKDQVGNAEITLTHEVGHYFGLPHPHFGWDAQPWSMEIHGCPAPVVSPGGQPTEKVDGSNCEEAGDRICDTPPDYNGFGWRDCNYEGGACDPNGTPIDPDETNFMGYFLNCNRGDYHFSPMQQELIKADVLTRQNLITVPPQNQGVVEDVPTLISPIDGEATGGANNIRLRWQAVNNASNYLVEVSRLPNFPSSNTESFIANSTELTLPSLEADKIYYWKVRPFNEYSTCVGFSPSFETFRTSMTTSTSDISFVENWMVTPNPVVGHHQFQLQFTTSRSFSGLITLNNVSGQLVKQMGQFQFSEGENILDLDASGLANGLYILNLQSNYGTFNEKVIIQKN